MRSVHVLRRNQMTMLTRLKTLGGVGMLSAIMELHDQITSTAAVHLDHCLSSHAFGTQRCCNAVGASDRLES